MIEGGVSRGVKPGPAALVSQHWTMQVLLMANCGRRLGALRCGFPAEIERICSLNSLRRQWRLVLDACGREKSDFDGAEFRQNPLLLGVVLLLLCAGMLGGHHGGPA